MYNYTEEQLLSMKKVEATREEGWHGIGPVPGPNGFVKGVSASCL